MDNQYKNFLESGKKIVSDTKTPKVKESKKQPGRMDAEIGDPHQVFVKRCIQERPKKSEIVEELMKFITLAEKDI